MGSAFTVVINPYNDPYSVDRPGAMLTGKWVPGTDYELHERGITALYLNVSRGWEQSDFSFLVKLPWLEELNIIFSDATGLHAIESLKNLQRLSLTATTRECVDFTLLKKLTNCYILYWPGASSILRAEGLERLYLDKPKRVDYSLLANMSAMRHLQLFNADIEDVSAIASLEDLEQLELVNCRKLAKFEPLARLQRLKRLTIRGNKKLHDLEFLSQMPNLRVLILSDNGELKSLSPLRNLTRLKAFSFVGSTVLADGDLQPLTELPELAMLGFAPRRHYSHKLIKPWNWRNIDTPDVLLQPK